MGDVTQSRFCPMCEQIVPREIEGIIVRISPARIVMLHPGCAEGAARALSVSVLEKDILDKMESLKNEEDKEEES